MKEIDSFKSLAACDYNQGEVIQLIYLKISNADLQSKQILHINHSYNIPRVIYFAAFV